MRVTPPLRSPPLIAAASSIGNGQTKRVVHLGNAASTPEVSDWREECVACGKPRMHAQAVRHTQVSINDAEGRRSVQGSTIAPLDAHPVVAWEGLDLHHILHRQASHEPHSGKSSSAPKKTSTSKDDGDADDVAGWHVVAAVLGDEGAPTDREGAAGPSTDGGAMGTDAKPLHIGGSPTVASTTARVIVAKSSSTIARPPANAAMMCGIVHTMLTRRTRPTEQRRAHATVTNAASAPPGTSAARDTVHRRHDTRDVVRVHVASAVAAGASEQAVSAAASPPRRHVIVTVGIASQVVTTGSAQYVSSVRPSSALVPRRRQAARGSPPTRKGGGIARAPTASDVRSLQRVARLAGHGQFVHALLVACAAPLPPWHWTDAHRFLLRQPRIARLGDEVHLHGRSAVAMASGIPSTRLRAPRTAPAEADRFSNRQPRHGGRLASVVQLHRRSRGRAGNRAT
jgi:hypothetical protein